MAYHRISFSAATACALFQKYGVEVNYCYDRKVPDSRGRMLCGYTLQDGDRVVVVDDMISSGKTLSERLDVILNHAKVEIETIVVIADRMVPQGTEGLTGSKFIEERYHTKLYSVITEKDIEFAIQS